MKVLNRRINALAISLSLITVAALGIVFQRKPLPILHLRFESVIEVVNPMMTVGQDWTEVQNQIFERPFFFSRDGKIEPQLAEDWTYDESFRVLKIRLKKGILFHNHKELDASDLKYSLECISQSNAQIESQMRFSNILKVEVIDKLTVVITLKEPSLDFLYFLASSNIRVVPKGILESSKNPMDYWVGTGAFQIDRIADKKITLTKFNAYRENVPLGGIEFIETKNEKELFKLGKLDLIEVARNEIAEYSSNPEYVTYSYPILGSFYLGFNLAFSKFQNHDLRMAIFHAIDRKRIVEGVEIEDFSIPGNIIPVGMPGYQSSGNTYNLELARKYLARVPKGEWPTESDMVVSLPLAPHPMAIYAVKAANEGLQKIGLSLKYLEVKKSYGAGKLTDFYTYLNNTKDFKLYLRGMIATYPSTDFFLRQVFSKGSPMNFGNFYNLEFETHMQKPPQDFLDASLDRYYKDALAPVNKAMAVIPLGNLKNNLVFRKKFPLKVNTLSPNFVLYKDSL